MIWIRLLLYVVAGFLVYQPKLSWGQRIQPLIGICLIIIAEYLQQPHPSRGLKEEGK